MNQYMSRKKLTSMQGYVTRDNVGDDGSWRDPGVEKAWHARSIESEGNEAGNHEVLERWEFSLADDISLEYRPTERSAIYMNGWRRVDTASDRWFEK
nr:hypothetical protein CFP56_13244 [Quercus suber]